MGYQSFDVKANGRDTTIPDNNLAKLMYYLSYVFNIIEFKEGYKYTNYREYYLLFPETEKLF